MRDEEMKDCPAPEQQLARLRAIVHRLRAPGGCPWDAEQTHESLVPNLIEEAYETIDAIQRHDLPHLREELGDLLLQVVFHSELAEEEGHFDLNEVAREVSEKLVRRHPHVFGDSAVGGTEAVLKQWDAIKRAEKGDAAAHLLDGVGQGLPALLRAAKLQKKAAKVGFDWPNEAGVVDKIREELDEFATAADAAAAAEELGDLLFSVVNLVRRRGLDPELVLARANDKFSRRFAAMEDGLKSAGKELGDADLEAMEGAWQAAKRSE
jgi:MazG family protein